VSFAETEAVDSDRIQWPAFVAVPQAKVLSGAPETSTHVLRDTPKAQMGLWRVTPGAFSTDHAGYVEFVHIIGGSGRLVSEHGAVTELRAGSTALLPEGWRGRWEIDATLTKSFTIIRD
jgi:uncharacterized cupin superfamily protein